MDNDLAKNENDKTTKRNKQHSAKKKTKKTDD